MIFIFFWMTTKRLKRGPKPGTMFRNVARTEMGRKVTAARRERGMTQEQLALHVGLTKRKISFYETRAVTIPSDVLLRMAQALRMSLDKLVTYTPSEVDITASRSLLKRLDKAKRLSTDKQKVICDLIDKLSE